MINQILRRAHLQAAITGWSGEVEIIRRETAVIDRLHVSKHSVLRRLFVRVPQLQETWKWDEKRTHGIRHGKQFIAQSELIEGLHKGRTYLDYKNHHAFNTSTVTLSKSHFRVFLFCSSCTDIPRNSPFVLTPPMGGSSHYVFDTSVRFSHFKWIQLN